jgi:hypothetical protein
MSRTRKDRRFRWNWIARIPKGTKQLEAQRARTDERAVLSSDPDALPKRGGAWMRWNRWWWD